MQSDGKQSSQPFPREVATLVSEIEIKNHANSNYMVYGGAIINNCMVYRARIKYWIIGAWLSFFCLDDREDVCGFLVFWLQIATKHHHENIPI